MSLTLADLRTLQTNFMSLDLDNYVGESPSSSDQNTQINWALRIVSKRLFLVDSKITFTPTADAVIQSLRASGVCGKRVVEPFRVTINGNMLWNCAQREYGLWSLAELERYHPKWQTDSSGTPTIAVYKGNNELILYLPPTSAVVSAAQNYIVGQVLAPDLSGTDTPAIPEECHECIAYVAAILAAEPVATEAEMWNRVSVFNSRWLAVIDEIASANRASMHSWGSTAGYEIADTMWM